MTVTIIRLIEKMGLLLCPECLGEGEVNYFCGHETTTTCHSCAGHGVVKSLNKQTHKKVCIVCQGKKGPGCCNNRGFHAWESYELIDADVLKSTTENAK